MGCTGAVPAVGHQASPRPRHGPVWGPVQQGPWPGWAVESWAMGSMGEAPGGLSTESQGWQCPQGLGVYSKNRKIKYSMLCYCDDSQKIRERREKKSMQIKNHLMERFLCLKALSSAGNLLQIWTEISECLYGEIPWKIVSGFNLTPRDQISTITKKKLKQIGNCF